MEQQLLEELETKRRLQDEEEARKMASFVFTYFTNFSPLLCACVCVCVNKPLVLDPVADFSSSLPDFSFLHSLYSTLRGGPCM